MVEFTLVLLPLLAFIFLILDVAWVIFAWASIQEGVREGVRFAITGKSDASIRAVVKTYSFGFIRDVTDKGPIQIFYLSAIDPSKSGTSCPGNIVKVVVSGISIAPMAPIWRNSSPLGLSASAADILEPNTVCTTR